MTIEQVRTAALLWNALPADLRSWRRVARMLDRRDTPQYHIRMNVFTSYLESKHESRTRA